MKLISIKRGRIRNFDTQRSVKINLALIARLLWLLAEPWPAWLVSGSEPGTTQATGNIYYVSRIVRGRPETENRKAESRAAQAY